MCHSIRSMFRVLGIYNFARGTKLVGDHLSIGTELVGDRLSRGTNQLGTNCGGPNVRGPYWFGTKCLNVLKKLFK